MYLFIFKYSKLIDIFIDFHCEGYKEIKRSVSSSWMKSWLLPLWQNEIFVQNYSYENAHHLYVHSLENQLIFM